MAHRNVLFLCVANSARSQMAEALARAWWGDAVHVQSAGSAPTRVHPLAIRVMKEIGISLADQKSTAVADVNPRTIDLVITLCAEEVCPLFLSSVPHLHWPVQDPDRSQEKPTPTAAAKIQYFREARDRIQRYLEDFQHTL